MASIQDYVAVRSLVSDIVSQSVAHTVSEVIRATVAAVGELSRVQPDRAVSVSKLADRLGLDRSAASRRVTVALQAGYLKNLEEKRGRPFKLVLGDPMPDHIELLPEPERLECCSVARDSEGTKAPPSSHPDDIVPTMPEAQTQRGHLFEPVAGRISFADDNEVL